MKERLIELMKEAETKVNQTLKEKFSLDLTEWLGIYADYLIENGVIVPTIKLNDIIYRCGEENVHEWQIVRLDVYPEEIVYIDDSDNEIFENDIGVTVFTSREEVEQKLKERKEDEGK